MLYAEYNKKMKKVAAFVNVLRRFKIPIIVVVALLLATVAALLGTRGIVYDSVKCPPQIVYGESVDYKAGAFLGNVVYEYRADGSDVWTREMPKRAGKYVVRAVSERTFGAMSYGKTYAFEILPKPLDLNVAATVVYGEKPQVTAELVYGDSISIGRFEYADISQTSTTVNVAADSVVITDENGEDVTSSYALNAVKSNIAFTARAIEITVEGVTEEYDGKPLTSSAWELTDGTLADGDSIVPVFDKSQTDVGETENTPQINVTHKVLNGDGIDVSANYAITQNIGMLTVKKRTVVITTADGTHEYDGAKFSEYEYKVSDETPIADGERLEIALAASLTDVDKAENLMVFKAFAADGHEVTDNYTFVVNAGTIEVTPRIINVRAANGTHVYDGNKYVNKNYTVTGQTTVLGHKLVVSSCSDITNVGTEINVLGFDVVAADGTTDVGKNYNVVCESGTLEVTPKTVTVVTATDNGIIYDGKDHFNDSFTSDGLVGDHSLKVVSHTVVNDVVFGDDGSVIGTPNSLGFEVVGTLGSNYNLEITRGVLTVNKRAVTIETPTESHVYDGTEKHTADPFVVQTSPNPLADAQSIFVVKRAGLTDVDSCDNDIEFEIVVNAVLNMIQQGVYTYDEFVELCQDFRQGLVEHDEIDEIIKTENYEITLVVGTLTVTKRPVTFTAGDCEKEYDGAPLVNTAADNFTADSGENVGLANGQKADATFVGSLTDAGEQKINEISSVVIYKTDDATKKPLNDNYDITLVKGSLKVTPRKVYVTTESGEWFYDGGVHSNKEFSVTRLLTELGHSLKVKTFTEVSEVKRGANNAVLTEPNELTFDVVGTLASNYEILYAKDGKGALKIKPRPIIVKTATNTKVYDGKEFIDRRFDIVLGTLVGGQSARVLNYNTVLIKNIGSVINVMDVIIENATKQNVTHNYDITYQNGTLTVTAREVTVKTNANSWVYNDVERFDKGYTVTSALDFVAGQTVTVAEYETITDVGKKENVLKLTVADEQGKNVTSNYKLTYVYQDIEVTARPVTVKAKDITRVYNGKVVAGDVYELTAGSLADGHSGAATLDAEYINVGKYSSVTVVKLDIFDGKKTEKTSNYAITYSGVAATLTITSRPITLSSFGTEDDERFYYDTYWYYDGTPKSFKAFGFLYERDDDGNPHPDKGLIFEYDAEIGAYTALHNLVGDSDSWSTLTDAGECENRFTAKITDKAGKDVTANYQITYEYGTLIVLPRPVKIVTASEEFVYNGDPQYNETWSEKSDSLGFVFDHALKVTSHTEITNVAEGTVDNVLTFDIINAENGEVKAKSQNYDITVEYGELVVLPRQLDVVTNSNEWTYDGNAHHDDGWDYAENSLKPVKDHRLIVAGYIEVKDVMRDELGNVVGKENVLQFEITGADASNYQINADNGTLTILPVGIVVRTEDLEKIYDDTPLNGGAAEVSGFLFGHRVLLKKLEVAITDVAQSGTVNLAEVDCIKDAQDNDVTDNYDITYILGKLTIQPRYIKILTATDEWIYDGEEHYNDGCEVTDGSLVDGHNLIVTQHTVIKNVGKKDNKLVVSVRKGEFVKTPNYAIEFEKGTLTVVKKSGGGSGDGDGDGPIIRLYSETDGAVYLRQMSYGDYTGKVGANRFDEYNWGDAPVYNGQKINYNGKDYGLNYLTSIALQNSGLTADSIEIELLVDYTYSLPYYLALADLERQTSDGEYSSSVTRYSAQFYRYDYLSDGGATLSSSNIGIYDRVEADYRKFVYEHYTSVPQATLDYMLGVIQKQRFRKDDPDVITKVSKYVRTAAKYDLDYDVALDAEDDVAVAFLETYKTGVCRHYATAATVLYRALGFPARYTVGFKGATKAGQWTEISDGHGWTEVYIDGIGWVAVEVTGSGQGSSGGDGNGDGDGNGGGGEGGDSDKEKLSIRPVEVSREYNGLALLAKNEVEDAGVDYAFKKLIELGYTYIVEVEGSRVEVGRSESVIKAFRLFDPSGEDVTGKYNIAFEKGIIWVTKKPVHVNLPVLNRAYDGTPLRFEELLPDIYGYYWDELPQGGADVVIDMGEYEGYTDVGKITAGELSRLFEDMGWCHVYAADGTDVTQSYTVVFDSGGLEITQREINIVTGSVDKIFDGTPLTCHEILMPIGGAGLVDGHEIQIEFTGAITDIGVANNSVKSVKITNGDGIAVTANYKISVTYGKLEIKP